MTAVIEDIVREIQEIMWTIVFAFLRMLEIVPIPLTAEILVVLLN